MWKGILLKYSQLHNIGVMYLLLYRVPLSTLVNNDRERDVSIQVPVIIDIKYNI